MIKEHLLNYPLIVPHIVFSEEKKFIYMKICKNAGTSIYRGLIKKEIPDEIMSEDNPKIHERWIEKLNDEKLKDYFIFSFVRNPWDRLVSVYFYFIKQGLLNPKISFEEFIKKGLFEETLLLKKHSHPQYPYIEYNGKTFVDFIGRFENLEEDWKFVANKIGVISKLPHKNKSVHEHYTKYYNEETKNIIAEKYKRDIELFGYKYLSI